MKVKLLKNHLNYREGDVVDVNDTRAKYWETVGVAEKAKKESKEPVKEKNEKAGPPQTKAPAKKAAPKKAAPKKETKLVDKPKKKK